MRDVLESLGLLLVALAVAAFDFWRGSLVLAWVALAAALLGALCTAMAIGVLVLRLLRRRLEAARERVAAATGEDR